jgi:hypothetical protein
MPSMGKTRAWRGKSEQCERPEWGPLRDAVGEQVMGDFMWMYEVTLTDGTALQVYKHIDTRRSVHLASDGTVYVFEPPDRYRRFPSAKVFAEVFASLPRLRGVTDEQIAASRTALERLGARGRLGASSRRSRRRAAHTHIDV